MSQLFRLSTTQRRDPRVEAWLRDHSDDLGGIAAEWFKRLRRCGEDVREAMHDGCPTACIGDAAFGYVSVHRKHVNVGFFRGAELPDPDSLLEGTGKVMRHVKIRRRKELPTEALATLITCAYADMKERCQGGANGT